MSLKRVRQPRAAVWIYPQGWWLAAEKMNKRATDEQLWWNLLNITGAKGRGREGRARAMLVVAGGVISK